MNTGLIRPANLSLVSLALPVLAACGGGYGGGGGGGGATYTIGGTVSGLAGSGLVLLDNGSNSLVVSATTGTFTFSQGLATGATYLVTVKTQPSSPTQNCVVTNGLGTVGAANVTNVAVACATAGRFAYAANAGDNTISVYSIDATTGALSAVGTPVATGTQPYAIAVDPYSPHVYVVNEGSNDISAYAVNVTSGDLTPIAGSPFHAGTDPQALAFNPIPSGTYLYVANNGSNNVSAYSVSASNGALAPLTPATYAAGTGPSAVSVSSDGQFLFVTNNGGSNDISAFAINAATGALTPVAGSPFPAGGNPHSLVLTPYGAWDYGVTSFLYTANSNATSSTISGFIVDQSTGRLTALSGSPFALAVSNYIATDRTGTYLYVTTGANVVGYRINVNTGLLAALPNFPVAAGANAYSVAVDPSNGFLYVGNDGAASVSGYRLDAATGGLTAIPESPFAAGNLPDFLATL